MDLIFIAHASLKKNDMLLLKVQNVRLLCEINILLKSVYMLYDNNKVNYVLSKAFSKYPTN